MQGTPKKNTNTRTRKKKVKKEAKKEGEGPILMPLMHKARGKVIKKYLKSKPNKTDQNPATKARAGVSEGDEARRINKRKWKQRQKEGRVEERKPTLRFCIFFTILKF